MTENMRGLFFIVKGQYIKNIGHSFINEATGSVNYIGGYDPESDDTQEWYMLIDNRTFNCTVCGSSIDKVLKGVHTIIKRYKGDLNKFLKGIGATPPVSPSTRCLYKEVYNTFGDYFKYEIEEMEDLAYTELKENTPFHKSRKLLKKKSSDKLVMETPKEELVLDITPPKKLVSKRVRIGVRKLDME